MDFPTSNSTVLECGKCEKNPGTVACICGDHFCEHCFTSNHLRRLPTHRRKPAAKYQLFWNTITNVLTGSGTTNHSDIFKKDEAAKWFGLVTKTQYEGRVSVIVETQRLPKLLESSLYAYDNSSELQFPSITSFVGPTGAGKSVLIRSLIHQSIKQNDLASVETPVPGATSGDEVLLSTTGEVNLYPDPSTFGTRNPIFFADCEGFSGSEPLAAKHQTEWAKTGRKYRVQVPMDRCTVVKQIYPQFLYIFSDVVCYVTRDHKSWIDTAIRLLKWSSIGAQNTINQYTLPALIIILNATTLKNKIWVSDDSDAVTKDFFQAIGNGIETNDELRSLADKFGDTNMLELFKRSYSSVHVHYIPLEGTGELGGVDTIYKQTERLLARIKSDTVRVQRNRAGSLTRFDSRQLSAMTNLAFKHLATGSAEPFDFGRCRQQVSVPDSLDLHFGEYLRHCFKSSVRLGLGACVSNLGTAILNNALSIKSEGTIFVPSVIFSPGVQETCQKAMDHFRDENAVCAYIDPESGARCVNTRAGHTKGHQSKSGAFMRGGRYIEEDGTVTTALFISSIERYITFLIQKFTADGRSTQRIWRGLSAEEHRKNIERLRLEGVYPRAGRAEVDDPFSSSIICYGCLFQNSEYLLPCGHTACENCIRANSNADSAKNLTGKHTVESCIICGTSIGPGWPFQVRLRPELSGIRILSLDGGGVRGIIGLTVLQRLESLIGLDLPIGEFFDFMAGTSSGGIIALSLGVQATSAQYFAKPFKNIWKDGLNDRLRNSGRFRSFWNWVFLDSVHFTENFEAALESYFKNNKKKVFGLTNHCRVALTTTVKTDGKLISNYNRGGSGRYLSSELSLADAARCTSAATPYLKPKMHQGDLCRDGGLKESNPVHVAVTESRSIWGDNLNYDLILSVGSGYAEKPQLDYNYRSLVDSGWLWNLFCSFVDKMNGEEAWAKFVEARTDRITERSSRLNVYFPKETEPAFNDIDRMSQLETAAEGYTAFEEPPMKSPFLPIVGPVQAGVLEALADRLRASLFFLHVNSIDKSDGFLIIVKGGIRCRLGPNDMGFGRLLSMTSSFKVNNEVIKYTASKDSSKFYFEQDIEFSHESIDQAVRIDVSFGKKHWIAISGCPITIREIMEKWDSAGAQDNAIYEAKSDDLPESESNTTDKGTFAPKPAASQSCGESSAGDGLFEKVDDETSSISDIDIRTLRTDDVSDVDFDIHGA